MSRYRILGRLDLSTPQAGTVLVNRTTGTFSVRPWRRRRLYTLPLAVVAEIVCSKVIKAEVAQKRAARKARRFSR